MKYKKLIAPIIITAILLLFLMLQITGVILSDAPTVFRVIIITIGVSFCGISIFVLIERIEEVKSGEEDDLDKY